MYHLSKLSRLLSSSKAIIHMKPSKILLLDSHVFELFESISILVELYLSLSKVLRSILLVSLKALTTQTLLACSNSQC